MSEWKRQFDAEISKPDADVDRLLTLMSEIRSPEIEDAETAYFEYSLRKLFAWTEYALQNMEIWGVHVDPETAYVDDDFRRDLRKRVRRAIGSGAHEARVRAALDDLVRELDSLPQGGHYDDARASARAVRDDMDRIKVDALDERAHPHRRKYDD